MIKINYTFILLLLLTTTSCSRYISYIEKQQRPELKIIKPKEKSPWCKEETKINVLHNDLVTIRDFPKYIIDSNQSITDLGLYYTLYQMFSRPDATDWYSRAQVHIKQGNKTFHHDFGLLYQYPVLNAFKELRKQGLLKKSIKYWVQKANNTYPRKIKVLKELNGFISQYQKGLRETFWGKNKFFKVDTPLQYKETYLRTNIRIPRTDNLPAFRPIIFPINESYSCNFDSHLYQKGIFLISNSSQRENTFGLVKENGDYFFMHTEKEIGDLVKQKTQILPGKKTQSLNPYCLISKGSSETVLIGSSSRDSGQLLYHLHNYGIHKAQTPEEVFEYIKYPRHQFLLKPARLLYESKKGTEKKLRYFLNLDFPVYHVENLGLIEGIWSQKNKSIFISDPRRPSFQSCQEN